MRHVMNDRLRTSPPTDDTDGGQSCQAERCSLPPSLLPWTFEHDGVTFLLRLCHEHGQLLTGEQPAADAGGEAA
jgi:hypothetical protein